MKPKITFDKGATPFILTCFGLFVDKKGFIVNKEGKSVLAPDGKPVNMKEFGGIMPSTKGPRLIRKTLPGLIDAHDFMDHHDEA